MRFDHRYLLVGMLCLGGLFVYMFAFGAGNLPDRSVYVVTDETAGDVTAHLVFPNDQSAPGLAHYTEHLAWLNAVSGAQRSADRHSNAWTTDTAVGYWLAGPPEDLPALIETLSRVFAPIDLPLSFAAEERDIVLREYELRMTGDPAARATEALNAFVYAGTDLAVSVIGTPDEIRALTYDAAREMHQATHVPELATLVVTGDVTARQVRRALRDADWPLPEEVAIAPVPVDAAETAQTTLQYPSATAAPRLIWRRIVTLPEPVPFDLLDAQVTLLRDILETNLPGGLAGPLRFDAALARSFEVEMWALDEDTIEMQLQAAPDRDVSLTVLRDAFEAALREAAVNGIPEETFLRVRARDDGFGPDWDDADDTAAWMTSYVLNRVSVARVPLSAAALKRIDEDVSLTRANLLLSALAGAGRTASAFIGPEEFFE